MKRTLATALLSGLALLVPAGAAYAAPTSQLPADGSTVRTDTTRAYIDYFTSEGFCGIDLGGFYAQVAVDNYWRIDRAGEWHRQGHRGVTKHTNTHNGRSVTFTNGQRNRLGQQPGGVCPILIRELRLNDYR